MKKFLLVSLLWVSGAAPAFSADGAVRLNNYDSNVPIFADRSGTRLPVEGAFVQFFAGPVFAPLQVISNTVGATVFGLAEPGFFDAGIGIFPGLPDGSGTTIEVRVWRNAPTYESTLEKSFAQFTQLTGSDSAPTVLAMQGIIIEIPEPSSYAFGILGTGVLLAARRLKR